MSKPARQTVWITRTQPSAYETAKAFDLAGFDTITAPLLTVTPKDQVGALPKKAVLIFTSQNGVRAFCEHHLKRDYSIITVGNATAALAREMGFNDVSSADGTSGDVTHLISEAPNAAAHYIHISGRHIRGSITEDLAAAGLKSERRIYYSSRTVEACPDIDLARVDIAAIFSPLAAKALSTLGLDMSGKVLLSISPAADDALGEMMCKDRIISTRPTLQSMIATLSGSV